MLLDVKSVGLHGLITFLRVCVPAVYAVVAGCYIAEFVKNRRRHFFFTKSVLFSGILFHIVLIALLVVQHNGVPCDTVFRGLLFCGLLVSILYSGMEHFLGEIRYGAFLFPVNFIITGVAVLFLDRGVPLPQALRSVYFAAHASLLFLSYACFFLSFAISCMYLLQHGEIKNHRLSGLFDRLPSLADMDRSVMRVDALGLGLLIIGMAIGLIWMEVVLGVPARISFKIAMSGLAVCIYFSEHLLRIFKGWNGQRACMISIVGFIFVLITLLVGRHGY
jgi:HemX protein